jgi:hypothetical protein
MVCRGQEQHQQQTRKSDEEWRGASEEGNLKNAVGFAAEIICESQREIEWSTTMLVWELVKIARQYRGFR